MTHPSRRSFLSLALIGVACRRHRAAPARSRRAAPGTPARRIVSLSPAATESLVALGFADRLVAVSALCAGAPGLPRVGTMVTPDARAIRALRPDALVGVEGPVAITTLQPVLDDRPRLVFPRAESLDDYLAALDAYASLVGAPQAADTLRARLRDGASRVSRAVSGRPRPRVLAIYTTRPLVAAGPGSWVDAVIQAAGGDNAAQSPNRHPIIAPEQAAAWAPSLVIDLTPEGATPDVTAALTPVPDDGAPGWTPPRAVRLEGALVRQQGPRFVEAVRAVARVLHPGVAL